MPTRFEIIDGQLIQHVEHRSADTAYPVVADPWWQWVRCKLKLVWRGIITTKIMVWWYESRGYTCDWWAAWWNAPVACYQTAS